MPFTARKMFIYFIIIIVYGFLPLNHGTAQNQKKFADAPQSLEIDNTLQGKPVIFIKERNWDFGTITEGDIVEHSFTLENNGTADLIISQIRTSCGCAAALLSKEILAPSENTTLTISFDSKGRSGLQRKEIFIKSNDPDNVFTTIVILANVLLHPSPRIFYGSDILDIGAVQIGSAPELFLELKNIGSQALSVYNIQHGSLCNAKLLSDNAIQPKGSSLLEIKFSPIHNGGLIEQFVSFSTNDPSAQIVNISIVGYVYGYNSPAMTVVPSSWDFGVFDTSKQDTLSRTFRIFNTGTDQLEITGVALPRDLTTSVSLPVTIEPDESLEITVWFESFSQKGTAKDNIIIYSNDPARPTRKITVCGYLK
ncbi:MAG: DUF1573 domain-containing protein [Candidatus Auribacterota bacterium]|jgi:hypothetical protein|nr:DUF1573 domain-containing protein [Candidatus Auribacterota bacterium]